MSTHAQAAAAGWAWWTGLLLGAVPLLALAVWHSNDACHRAAFALKRWRHCGARPRLPPGHMGLPFVGESLWLLWYYKHARRPDGFVHARRRRYYDAGAVGTGTGDVGMYRTHLFGSPTILVCSPAANKFVLKSPLDGTFGIRWPAPELVGLSCVVNVEGSQHARLRGFILGAINRPGSLRTIAEVVQPRVVAALRSWADKGTISAATEIKKVTFENICKMFVSMDPSPLTDMMDEWFVGLVAGFRAFPLDFPGTAYRHARAGVTWAAPTAAGGLLSLDPPLPCRRRSLTPGVQRRARMAAAGRSAPLSHCHGHQRDLWWRRPAARFLPKFGRIRHPPVPICRPYTWIWRLGAF